MRSFTLAAVASALIASSNAAVHDVLVGNGSLVYSPETTYANVGDTVVFHFYPQRHDVVSGPFNTPCQSTAGIYSGFIPSTSGQANSTFHVKINDTNPIWYYCSQAGAGGHCTKGMVGVINPPNGSTTMTLAAYKAGAANVANTSYTVPSAVGGGVVVLRNTTAAAATSSGTPSSSAGPSATQSGAATGTTSKAASATPNAAGVLDAARWGAGAVAGGLAVLLL